MKALVSSFTSSPCCSISSIMCVTACICAFQEVSHHHDDSSLSDTYFKPDKIVSCMEESSSMCGHLQVCWSHFSLNLSFFRWVVSYIFHLSISRTYMFPYLLSTSSPRICISSISFVTAWPRAFQAATRHHDFSSVGAISFTPDQVCWSHSTLNLSFVWWVVPHILHPWFFSDV